MDWTALEALLGSIDVEALLAQTALTAEQEAFLDELAQAHVPDPALLVVDAAFLDELARQGDEALAGLEALLDP